MFRDFNHLLTTAPHSITQVFISDLHLSEHIASPYPSDSQTQKHIPSPLVLAFLAFLDDLSALPNLRKLFILGDWFEVWIGDDDYLSIDDDDKPMHWLTSIIQKLKQMRVAGCQILIMHGNRDFLLGQPFCNTFAGELIEEPYFTKIGNHKVRLEHGDALCTDDKDYQKFRKRSRIKLVQWWFLRKPLHKRQRMANGIRKKSKQATAKKTNDIMDVNHNAVLTSTNDITYLIHGHTHRPALHHIQKHPQTSSAHKSSKDFDNTTKSDLNHNIATQTTRFVLGDWRINELGSRYEQVTAVIGVVTQQQKQPDPDKQTSTTLHINEPIKDYSTNELTEQPDGQSVDFELLNFVWKKH